MAAEIRQEATRERKMRDKIKLEEMFCIEAVDDEGRPLRTPDPFAPPVKHKAAVSQVTAPGRNTKSQERTPPSPDAEWAPPDSRKVGPMAKPQYKGTFIGQTFTTKSPFYDRKVGYKKPDFTGMRRGGGAIGRPSDAGKRAQASSEAPWMHRNIPTQDDQTVVWDGNDWIPQSEFDYKAKQQKLGKK